MKISVVIPTYNQKERLRLVLCGLENQILGAEPFEIIVVDDGATDGTRDMLASRKMENLKVVRMRANQGPSRARNRGFERATGELLVLLDGDALPAPDLLQTYWEAYQRHGARAVFCGLYYSLPDLEYFQDPQTGVLMDRPMPSVMKDYLHRHLDEQVITEAMIRDDFSTLHARARKGGYPFSEIEQMQEEVLDLSRRRPGSPVSWIGFYPHNAAIPLEWVQATRGFDEQIPFSEGWEWAYRLQQEGSPIYPVPAASYHLYHFHDFSGPKQAQEEKRRRYQAIEYMVHKHQNPRIRLLFFWFAHLFKHPFFPEKAVIDDLVEFDERYQNLSADEWEEYELVLAHHPLHLSV